MVCVLHSITRIDEACRDAVVVAASHGNTYAGHCAVEAGVRGVVLHDAGVGKDRAGVGSLAPLDELGVPCATVDYRSARIGDGDDVYANGRISHVNETAAALGCEPEQAAAGCAERMRDASPSAASPPEYGRGRHLLDAGADGVRTWGIDSVSMLRADDAGDVVVTGSHGARLPDEDAKGSYVHAAVAAIAFNDAGGGPDGAGTSRLPVLAERDVPAVAIDCHTARIGDARSAWRTGVVGVANAPARDAGVVPGTECREFAAAVVDSGR